MCSRRSSSFGRTPSAARALAYSEPCNRWVERHGARKWQCPSQEAAAAAQTTSLFSPLHDLPAAAAQRPQLAAELAPAQEQWPASQLDAVSKKEADWLRNLHYAEPNSSADKD